ncbi:MAG: Rieske (2Fe-2S) protein [Anaerolineales bacterium]|nr:Rieske (2Fe-2S) protein [Anaerolineales bacterium]MCX7607988.1 Rieske (2Fe-2S) protein [Anaerolineales bacterium]MDW8226667.1 Rieske (2Fe-2S) protein [Anaerolineales bacterium]
MTDSHHISRRDFIKLATIVGGGVIGTIIGIPGLVYLLDPALKSEQGETWISLGPLENFEIGKPTLVTFVRSRVNGWEKTSSSYGVFVLRKSETDVVVFSNLCTHLHCRVNWVEEKRAFVCPCHDAAFDIDGNVLGGPPPRPLDRYEGEHAKIEDGVIKILFKEG